MDRYSVVLLIVMSIFKSQLAFFILDDLEREMGKNGPPFEYLFKRSSNGTLTMEDLTDINILPTATTKHVVFYFYSKDNIDIPVKINVTDVASLSSKTSFDTSKQTLFIIHGWLSNYTSPVNELIRKAVLPKYDVNLFVVDWSDFSQKNYILAFVNVPDLGEIIGEFINKLSTIYEYPLDKIKLVGHSLGAHIAGISGKATNGRIRSIMGLDPAGPLFTIIYKKNRLDKGDARYVQVMHTCGKILGFYPEMGDSDYYPNGGLSQPGCGLINDIGGTCSHSRAYEYYAESLRTENFIATKCDNYYFQYVSGSCRNNSKTHMGTFDLEMKKGKYYLNTDSSAPYAKET